MHSDSKDHKKNRYFPPTLTKLTPEQAKKLVADRKGCSEEDATDFLNSLRRRHTERPPDDERKRSA